MSHKNIGVYAELPYTSYTASSYSGFSIELNCSEIQIHIYVCMSIVLVKAQYLGCLSKF